MPDPGFPVFDADNHLAGFSILDERATRRIMSENANDLLGLSIAA